MRIMHHELSKRHWRRIAKRNGIQSRTFDRRIQLGWSERDAATRPLVPPGSNRPDPCSTKQKLKAAGLGLRYVWQYRNRHPDKELTDDEIIAIGVDRKRRAG